MDTKWKLAIFDYDGTLVNTLDVAYGAACEIFRKFAPEKIPPTLEEYRNGLTADVGLFYRGHGIPENITLDEINAVFNNYSGRHKSEKYPYSHAKALLKYCRELDMRIAIVSASPENLEEEFARFGLLPHLDKIIGNAHDKESAIVETVDFFGVRAEEAFYCNDTYDGLMAAKNLGISTIGVTHGYNSPERVSQAEPNFIAASLLEVDDYIFFMQEVSNWEFEWKLKAE